MLRIVFAVLTGIFGAALLHLVIILSLPHFLVVHLPEPLRAGEAGGWNSKVYRDALKTSDAAMGSVLDLYKELGLLNRTTILVTSLNDMGTGQANDIREIFLERVSIAFVDEQFLFAINHVLFPDDRDECVDDPPRDAGFHCGIHTRTLVNFD